MPLVPITLQPGLTASRLKNQSAATLVNMYAERSSGKVRSRSSVIPAARAAKSWRRRSAG